MAFFLYDPDMLVLTGLTAREADRDHRDTDAGQTGSAFVVEATDADAARDGACRWVACWADASQTSVPDDLSLDERQWGRNAWKTYHLLLVS